MVSKEYNTASSKSVVDNFYCWLTDEVSLATMFRRKFLNQHSFSKFLLTLPESYRSNG
jgi:hypothetical protein